MVESAHLPILAIETSFSQGEVAVAVGNTETGKLAEIQRQTLPAGALTAQVLVPAMRDAVAAAGWQPGDLELVVVARGPGSFTGLRIGLTAAKTVAHFAAAPIIGIDTLRILDAQCSLTSDCRWAVLDGFRGQLFARQFSTPPGGRNAGGPLVRVDYEAFAELAGPGAVINGAGITRIQNAEKLVLSPTADWQPRAATLLKLGWDDYLAGIRDDPLNLMPSYGRPSAAEERRDRKRE